MTATRIRRGATLAVAAAAWCVCAWLLARTTVPHLRLGGFDERRSFTGGELRRARRYTLGADLIWIGQTLAGLLALALLALRLPGRVRRWRFGRLRGSLACGALVVVALWLTGLPFALGQLWWAHHWGLGPFHVVSWLGSLWSSVLPEAAVALVGIAVVVALAARFPRRWPFVAAPLVVAAVAGYAFAAGYLAASGTRPIRNPALRSEVQQLERIEQVEGTPVRVGSVSGWTSEANAFTSGFGPSTRVVLWNTLLDGRFTFGEQRVVLAHELGHVRSRHVLKGIGWAALAAFPVLWVVERLTRRQGGVGDPANVPLALLVLSVLALLALPAVNAVSRRYEAEADWRALNATRDPAAARELFVRLGQTSLEDPDPPLLDYLFVENHPTLMQRIGMAQRWTPRR